MAFLGLSDRFGAATAVEISPANLRFWITIRGIGSTRRLGADLQHRTPNECMGKKTAGIDFARMGDEEKTFAIVQAARRASTSHRFCKLCFHASGTR